MEGLGINYKRYLYKILVAKHENSYCVIIAIWFWKGISKKVERLLGGNSGIDAGYQFL